jgi:death-on-curing family protein
MIKNHSFENGNKKIAIMTLLYFFYKNGYWIKTSNEILYDFAKQIAESNPKQREAVMFAIQGFLKAYLI